jgi:hypothetical protein
MASMSGHAPKPHIRTLTPGSNNTRIVEAESRISEDLSATELVVAEGQSRKGMNGLAMISTSEVAPAEELERLTLAQPGRTSKESLAEDNSDCKHSLHDR